MSDFINEELLNDWFEEAYEQIAQMEENLLILEKDITNKEAIDSIFRAAHTLKGGAATVQMKEITKFTHVTEDTMDEIREGKISVTSEIVDVLLDALDIIKNMVNARKKGTVYNEDYSTTTDLLNSIVEKQENSEKTNIYTNSKTTDTNKLSNKNEFKLGEYDLLEISQANPDNLPLYKVLVEFDETNPMRTVGGIQIFTSLREIAIILKTIPEFEKIYSEDFNKEIMYIIATDAPTEKIKEFSVIPDATLNTIIQPISSQPQELNKKKNSQNTTTETSIDEIAQAITNESLNSMEQINANNIEKVNSEIKNITKPKIKKQKNKANFTSSVLRVDSSRIDDLLNLVSEIVINKASFNQVNIMFNENSDILNLTLSEYKDKIKQLFDKFPIYIEEISKGKTLASVKKTIQSEFGDLNNIFDKFLYGYKTAINRFKATSQNLDRTSSELREGVMRIRMVQIKHIFTRFPRLVRDLSKDLNKKVELVLRGEETEIDKAMIDDLIDPLIHIVRNAIDHGIESTDKRQKLGKKVPAILKLSAFNEGNLITIYISDDGKGIDKEQVKQKAIEKGIISKDRNLTEQEVFNLIFNPGFSTSSKVTSVSGRGVGLDVVKKNVEKLSGTIRVTSQKNKGTTFTIKLPLTLAIIQGLLVKVFDEIYAIPISSVLESIRIKAEEIKFLDNYEVINVREDVLSLLRLNRLFNLGEDIQAEYYFVVIIGTGDKKIGLLVDSLIGEEDIVIKPLKDKYTNTPGVAGATILGDGTVSLILDVSQIIELGLKIESENRL